MGQGQSLAKVNQKLRPAEDLRRPDKHGQMSHIVITELPDVPLREISVGEILAINWEGVETAIEDAVVRVSHEGDLSSATMQETLQLISLALQKLSVDHSQLHQDSRARTGFLRL